MPEFLGDPAVQGAIAPFVVALIVVAALHRLRLGGLALVAALGTAVYFVAGFTFTPLTATRKIFLLGFAAPIVGILVDFAFKPTRIGAGALALGGAAAALWVLWPVLAQKGPAEAWLLGGTAALTVAWLVGTGMTLAEQPVRGGAAALALGLGTGITAILGASNTYGLYGIALGAGAGAFLLVQMLTGKKIAAGATFMLPAALVSGLLGAGAMVLAKVPWYALLALALIPLAAQLPGPEKLPVWPQAIVFSLYAFIPAVAAFVLAWQA